MELATALAEKDTTKKEPVPPVSRATSNTSLHHIQVSLPCLLSCHSTVFFNRSNGVRIRFSKCELFTFNPLSPRFLSLLLSCAKGKRR